VLKMKTRIQDCKLIPFFHQPSEKGEMVSAHGMREIPFEVQRVYYLYEVEEDRKSGNHANIHNQQVMVAVQGSFEVNLHDGQAEQSFLLDNAHEGLLVREGIWRQVGNFSTDAVCLVLCSEQFEEGDYLKDFGAFVDWKK
jgi:hypothetical protein